MSSSYIQNKKFKSIELPYSRTQGITLFDSLIKQDPYPIFLDSCVDLRDYDYDYDYDCDNKLEKKQKQEEHKSQNNKQTRDIISAAPYLVFKSERNTYQILNKDDQIIESEQEHFNAKKAQGTTFKANRSKKTPLNRLIELQKNEPGSLLGYFGYHCNDEEFLIKKESRKEKKEEELPDICVGFYAWKIIIDHQKKTSTLYYLVDKLTNNMLQRILSLGKNSVRNYQKFNEDAIKNNKKVWVKSNFSPEDYLKAFKKIKNYINSGDCYQTNLAQRFCGDFDGNSWLHYQYLRTQSPAPYAAFFSIPEGDILSFSPECFLEITTLGKINSQPIKGTRKRYLDRGKDNAAKKELAESKKDQAENLMIVDLIRNDLSKSAKLNSVKVDALFKIESFSNIHHMVSHITAQKTTELTPLEVLLNGFPGGSITGAPKKRSMEIIQELEPNTRQVYCGAIGYLGFNQSMKFNIAIRTIIIKNEKLYCWGGGGLVSDSNAEDEFQESITKINNIVQVKHHQKKDNLK